MRKSITSMELVALRGDDYFEKMGHAPSKYSVLAKSVYQLNYDLIHSYKGDSLLEVGCGSDSVFAEAFGGRWYGFDVVKPPKGVFPHNFKVGSVGAIPFENDQFDLVVSNQSIEHWFEYGVSLVHGLSEINRVLRLGGILKINFPIHLHGHRIFVLNQQSLLEKAITQSGFNIEKKIKVEHNSEYRGWRLCGFFDSYIKYKSEKFLGASYVMEFTLKKERSVNYSFTSDKTASGRKTKFQRRLHHGLPILMYSLYRRIFKK